MAGNPNKAYGMEDMPKVNAWCNQCNREWIDMGEEVCPHCGSHDTEIEWLVVALSYPERKVKGE